MDMRIENIPSGRIVFMRREGSYGAENMKLMERFKNWVKEKDLWNLKTVVLGIAQDNPAFVKPEECCYDVCLVISEVKIALDDEIFHGEISGGKYAVFEIDHTEDAVQKAWNDIFRELLKWNCIEDKSRPFLERYRNKLVSEHHCEICVPIL